MIADTPQELIVLSYDKEYYRENENWAPNEEENEQEEEDHEDSSVPWANLIFLPFHPIFEIIVLTAVILMSILGPLKAVFSFMYCKSLMDDYVSLTIIKFYYKYCCSPIFIIDVVLHMLHRQITTEARRREHLPKSELCLLLDFIACIPFYQMMIVTESDECPVFQFWPHVMAFTEFLVVYRIVEYFSLVTTHSIVNITVGSIILWFITVNCLTCIHLIMTKIGYCDNCHKRIYDWRSTIVHKLNETDVRYTSYVYGMAFVISYTGHRLLDTTRPFTLGESFFAIILMTFGYVVLLTCVEPKIICEAMLYIRRIIEYKPKVNRIIAEVERRNPGKRNPVVVVESFYALTWAKRSGLTHIPEITLQLPRYIRLEVSLDLFWQVFYHSPTFRTTSNSFKRLLSENIRLDYKLPGEKFFVGPQAQTHLYYIKSGLVQLISADDGTTSLLSMTSGTIFGDISFLVPPIGRTVEVRCVTYCEVFYISRFILLSALRKFPEDRREVMKRANDRIKHAEQLSKCKELVRGLDRAEDENIYWIKKRWWELSDTIDTWKKKASGKGSASCTLPPDDSPYHCTKYLGQLVLCTEAQLHRKSMFAKFTFPWILLPNSLFNVYWHKIVLLTVYLVLVLYPPNISRKEPYSWFLVVQFRTDCVYCIDLLILLMTAIIEQEVGQSITFSDVLFARFKTFSFWLDVLATLWFENLFMLLKKPALYWISMYNRLLKVKILFVSEIQTTFDSKVSTIKHLVLKIVLVIFCYCYVGGFIFAYIERKHKSLTTTYWMGQKICSTNITKNECDPELEDVLYMSYSWLFNLLFTLYSPQTLMDIYCGIIITMTTSVLLLICQGALIAALYLTDKDVVEYQYFVTNLKEFYKIYKIHPDLMMRLDTYLVCHWKYYKGMDVMKPNILINEPFDIYWHAHGELAVRIIGNCGAFKAADSTLIRELAYKTKFLLRPKNTTIVVFGVHTKNVTWLAQGWIKCEYHDQEGEIRKKYLGAGSLISPTSVFLGTPSFRTYTTYTTCETLFIKVKDFHAILKRYPNEWLNIQNAIKEYGDLIKRTQALFTAQHADYEAKLQERVFHAHMDIYVDEEKEEEDVEEKDDLKDIFGLFFHDPQSKFVTTWCMVRAIAAFVIVICATLQGVTGTSMTAWAEIIEIICILFIAADICIKFTTGYYTEEGILVRDLKSCALHYASRTLIFDIVACMQMHKLIVILDIGKLEYKDQCIMNSVIKLVTQMYVIVGYLNYLADVPSSISVYIKILKWQIVMILVRFTASQYFFSLCFDIEVNETTSDITLRSNQCWLPTHIHIDERPTFEQLLLVLAESFIISESGMLRLNLSMFNVNRARVTECLLLAALGILFWYVTAYTISMLCLCKRKNATFRYGVTQLRQFLQAERVEEKIVEKVLAHFKYLWMRTDGIDTESIMQARIGVVFRRDLSYFFFSRTLHALNTILKGDEYMLKRISGVLTTDIYMKGEDIIRQDDLNNTVYIVNRGIVGVAIDGEQVAVLTKGSIFGQLDGTTPRPSRITAYALEHTDILHLTAKEFEDEIDAPVAEYIKSAYSTFKQDYIHIKKPVAEDPRNTIPYLLRGKKIIQLPWMKGPEDAQKGDSWYRMWLVAIWVISPVTTACIVLLLTTMPDEVKWSAIRYLFISDALHILFLCGEYFTLRVVIIEDRCVYRQFGSNLFKDPITYVSMFSIVAPTMTYVTGKWLWQLARIFRLRLLYNFHLHFCKTFRTSITPTIMKLLYILLILHVVTIGWMMVSCRSWDGEYKYLKPVFYTIPARLNNTIDYDEWTTPSQRHGYGCKRLTIPYIIPESNSTDAYHGYIVAKNWHWDYLVAVNYIMIIYTQTDCDMMLPFTPGQAFFNCFIMQLIYFLNLWVISSVVSYVYMNIRNLYNFDYSIQSLIIYLKHAGLSSSILESVMDYTSQLWKRQSGNWLPNLALETTLCLREDILGALYMHHLTGPPLFKHLPPYFLRQLVTKLRRIVIFPGKCVVNQNDIYGCIYFIHDGEVEKWHTDQLTGEKKIVSYLFTCDYFGLMPGLFPDEPHTYSYVTRSVTDFICLIHADWQDLLEGYPDVKEKFYDIAAQVRNREQIITNHRHGVKSTLYHEKEE